MSTILTGSTATDPTTAPTATCPADGDSGTAASVDGAFQAILNGIAWLRSHVALLAGGTFTGAVNFLSTVSIAATTTHTGGDINLTAAATQNITKSGGSLAVGTSTANDLQMIANGVIVAAFAGQGAAPGTLYMNSHRITSMADPTVATDAATKGYVDGLTYAAILPSGMGTAEYYSATYRWYGGAPAALKPGATAPTVSRITQGQVRLTHASFVATGSNAVATVRNGIGYCSVTPGNGSLDVFIRDNTDIAADLNVTIEWWF